MGRSWKNLKFASMKSLLLLFVIHIFLHNGVVAEIELYPDAVPDDYPLDELSVILRSQRNQELLLERREQLAAAAEAAAEAAEAAAAAGATERRAFPREASLAAALRLGLALEPEPEPAFSYREPAWRAADGQPSPFAVSPADPRFYEDGRPQGAELDGGQLLRGADVGFRPPPPEAQPPPPAPPQPQPQPQPPPPPNDFFNEFGEVEPEDEAAFAAAEAANDRVNAVANAANAAYQAKLIAHLPLPPQPVAVWADDVNPPAPHSPALQLQLPMAAQQETPPPQAPRGGREGEQQPPPPPPPPKWAEDEDEEQREPDASEVLLQGGVQQKPAPSDNADLYFIAIVAGCCAAAVVGIIAVGVSWYRLQKSAKAAADVEYPAYGVTGPNKDVSPTGDRRLAQSAQMYHYQHQKQQIIAMESRIPAERNGSVSEAESEEENEEGDYTVYECPGLAPTGEMEVKNPLFHDDPTPATPAGGPVGGGASSAGSAGAGGPSACGAAVAMAAAALPPASASTSASSAVSGGAAGGATVAPKTPGHVNGASKQQKP